MRMMVHAKSSKALSPKGQTALPDTKNTILNGFFQIKGGVFGCMLIGPTW